LAKRDARDYLQRPFEFDIVQSGDLAVVTVVPPKVEPTETPEAG